MQIIVTLIIIFMFFPVCANAEFQLGVGTHIFVQDLNKNIVMFNKSGINSLRDDFTWGAIEKEKGKLLTPQKLEIYLREAGGESIEPIMVLGYGNKFYDGGKKPVSAEGIAAFTRYAGFAAKQLRGHVKFFEIWNEWDQSAEPKSAESYFELVKAVAPGIKAVNKDAIILAGAATTAGIRKGWIEKLVKLGVLKYVDGISIHPYIHCERDKSPEAWIKFVSETSARLQKANDGKTVPLYITEMGWPSHNGACGSSPDTVAQYLARALLLVRTLPEVKGFWWYDLKNDGEKITEREHNFGLLNYDYAPKPAFAALRDVAPFVINARTVVRQPAPDGIVSLALTNGSGKKSFALWTENGKSVKVHITTTQTRDAIPTLVRIGTSSQPRSMVTTTKNEYVIQLNGSPQITAGIESMKIIKVD